MLPARRRVELTVRATIDVDSTDVEVHEEVEAWFRPRTDIADRFREAKARHRHASSTSGYQTVNRAWDVECAAGTQRLCHASSADRHRWAPSRDHGTRCATNCSASQPIWSATVAARPCACPPATTSFPSVLGKIHSRPPPPDPCTHDQRHRQRHRPGRTHPHPIDQPSLGRNSVSGRTDIYSRIRFRVMRVPWPSTLYLDTVIVTGSEIDTPRAFTNSATRVWFPIGMPVSCTVARWALGVFAVSCAVATTSPSSRKR